MTQMHHSCYFNRRDFIRIGSLAPFGLSLGGVLHAEKPRRDISIILLWQSGG
jgi:hypothetical protein